LVIGGVIFLLFGASRIPSAFRSLGEGINSFKEGLEGKKEPGAEGDGGGASDSNSNDSSKSEEASSA